MNKIFMALRKKILEISMENAPLGDGEIEVDESYFGVKRVRGKRGRGAEGKTKVFGVLKRQGKVYTQVVKNCSAAELIPIIKNQAKNEAKMF